MGKYLHARHFWGMALLGALLIAAPAKADYSQVVDWMDYDSTKYDLVNLITLNKDGSWYAPDSAWSVQPYGGGSNADQYWVSYNGTGSGYENILVAMTGKYGNPLLGIYQPDAICHGVSLELVDGSWYPMGLFSGVDNMGWGFTVNRSSLLPDGTFYPDGGVNQDVNAIHFFDFSILRGASIGEGGMGWRFLSALPENFQFQIFAIKAIGDGNEVPEPATLVMLGLAAVGLPIARRFRKQ